MFKGFLKKKFRYKIIVFLLITVCFSLINKVSAQNITPEYSEGKIIEIRQEKIVEENQKQSIYQELTVEITEGSNKGNKVEIINNPSKSIKASKYELGDNVYVIKSNIAGEEVYNIADYVRRPVIYVLFAIFILLTLLIAGKKGIYSVIGLAATFLILFIFVLPQLLAKQDPILTAILGALGIIFVSFYLTHGFNKKTTIAVIGTTLTLIIVGIFSSIFINLAKLSGFASEEALFLSNLKPDLSIQGLLLASIIIGMVGILDDITISQSSIAYELKKAAPDLKFNELYKKTMNVGKDHIASIVNTLIVVYTSAALPLLLLFLISENNFSNIINMEIVAEEVVRTLIASIGLIVAVPITTFIACYFLTKTNYSLERSENNEHNISHLSHSH